MSEEINTELQDNGKTVAIISYLTIIGWIIALVMHNNNKTPLGAYHLRQTLALIILGIIIWMIDVVLFSGMLWYYGGFIYLFVHLLFILIGLGMFALWLIGFIAAVNGQEKPIPIIGIKAQQWFAGIK